MPVLSAAVLAANMAKPSEAVMVSVPLAPLTKRPAPSVPACALKTMWPSAQVAAPWLTKLRPSSRPMLPRLPISVVVPRATVLPLPTIKPPCQSSRPFTVRSPAPASVPPCWV